MDHLNPNEEELQQPLDSAEETVQEPEAIAQTPAPDEEFDIESIIQEFRDTPEEAAVAPEPEEDPVDEAIPEPPAVTSDTIRLDSVKLTASAYAGAVPVEEDDEEETPVAEEIPEAVQSTEPFSEQWE